MSTDASPADDDRPRSRDTGSTKAAAVGRRSAESGGDEQGSAGGAQTAETDAGRDPSTGHLDVKLEEQTNERLDLSSTTEPSPGVGGPARMSFAERVRNTDRVQLLIVCLIGVALVFFVRGLTLGVTGSDRYRLRAGIESVLPVPESVQVGANQSIVVDLEPLSTGVLIIDGVELETVNLLDYPAGPGKQVELPPVTIFEPGNATLTFTPSRDAEITSFEPGEHTVEVRYWKEADGPQRARSYSWNFRAA